MGHAGSLGHIHPDHILKQLEQGLGAAGVELLGGLCSLGHKAGAGGDPLLEILFLDQILHGAVLKHAKARFPQVVHCELVACIGEQNVRGLHSAHQRGGEHRVHLRILEPLLQLLQLGASLITQGDVRAAADVQALQITGRHAVADEMKFERFHGKTPLSGKEFLFAVKFRTGSGHPARAVRHKICVDYL